MSKLIATGHRRKFIKQAMSMVLSATALPTFAGGSLSVSNANSAVNDKKPPLPAELVSDFVRQAHFDLQRVKEMLEKEPMLVNACWDVGAGDFETALGGASHVGNRDIANYLLAKGARKDIFCAAMLGERDLVKSFISSNPGIANIDGPHRYSLLFHVAISGDWKMGEILKQHVIAAADFNQALHSAVRNGHVEMSKWLLKNGVDDPNTNDFAGNTPIQTAEKKGVKEMVDLLKKYGGK